MSWELPTSVQVGNKEYSINSDFRDILYVMEHMNDENLQQGALCALYVFYEDFSQIPEDYIEDAWNALCSFIRCGEAENTKHPSRKLIDWEQDANMVAAEVSKIAGSDIRGLPYLHWYTFMGYFGCIGDGQLSTIVSIRSKKDRGKKLEKWEQEYYRENRDKIDFAKKYSPEELDEKTRLLKMLGV